MECVHEDGGMCMKEVVQIEDHTINGIAGEERRYHLSSLNSKQIRSPKHTHTHTYHTAQRDDQQRRANRLNARPQIKSQVVAEMFRLSSSDELVALLVALYGCLQTLMPDARLIE